MTSLQSRRMARHAALAIVAMATADGVLPRGRQVGTAAPHADMWITERAMITPDMRPSANPFRSNAAAEALAVGPHGRTDHPGPGDPAGAGLADGLGVRGHVLDQRGQAVGVEQVGRADGQVLAHVVERRPHLPRPAPRPAPPRPAGRRRAGRRPRALPGCRDAAGGRSSSRRRRTRPPDASAKIASIRPRTSRSLTRGLERHLDLGRPALPHSPASNRVLRSARSASSATRSASTAPPSSSTSISRIWPNRSSSQRWNAVPALRPRRRRPRHRPPDLRGQLGRIPGHRDQRGHADPVRQLDRDRPVGPPPGPLGQQQVSVGRPAGDQFGVARGHRRPPAAPAAPRTAPPQHRQPSTGTHRARASGRAHQVAGLADRLVPDAARGGAGHDAVSGSASAGFSAPSSGGSAHSTTSPAPASQLRPTSCRNAEGPSGLLPAPHQ